MIYSFSDADAKKSSDLTEILTEKVADVTKEPKGTETFKDIHKVVRKIGHIVEFFILGVVSFLLALSYNLSVKRSIIISLAFCTFYAVTDEIHQLFVDGRTGRVIDVFIDFCGSVAGVGVVKGIEKFKTRNKTK